MIVEVVVPTYRRPPSLLACLRALAAQTRTPDRVLVIAREDDGETLAALGAADLPAWVEVDATAARGQVAQLNRGLSRFAGDVLAITDDDTVPDPDWLERIEAWFLLEPATGAVGGPDWQRRTDPRDRRGRVVGRITWFGHVLGAHHLGSGGARAVDHLKGANMAFRAEAIRGLAFDERLRGSAAQGSNDTAFCLAVRRRGWRVVYDPAVRVEHVPDFKWGEDPRDGFNAQAQANNLHNQTLVVLEHLPWWRRPVFLAWSLLLGVRIEPGLFHLLLARARRQPDAWERFRATQAGRLAGWRTWLRSRRPPRPPA